jgi:hypothetical protein
MIAMVLADSFSSPKARFISGILFVGFVVDKVALG